jgi:hypothetical protein
MTTLGSCWKGKLTSPEKYQTSPFFVPSSHSWSFNAAASKQWIGGRCFLAEVQSIPGHGVGAGDIKLLGPGPVDRKHGADVVDPVAAVERRVRTVPNDFDAMSMV